MGVSLSPQGAGPRQRPPFFISFFPSAPLGSPGPTPPPPRSRLAFRPALRRSGSAGRRTAVPHHSRPAARRPAQPPARSAAPSARIPPPAPAPPARPPARAPPLDVGEEKPLPARARRPGRARAPAPAAAAAGRRLARAPDLCQGLGGGDGEGGGRGLSARSCLIMVHFLRERLL